MRVCRVPLVAAFVSVALLATSCSDVQSIDLEPTTGIAATCEFVPDENARADDRWDSGVDAFVFVQPAVSAGAIIRPVDGGFDESPAVAAGDLAVVLDLLEKAPAVSRVELQSKEDAYRAFTDMFDPEIIEPPAPDVLPVQISVWADTSKEFDLPFRSLQRTLRVPSQSLAFSHVAACRPQHP